MSFTRLACSTRSGCRSIPTSIQCIQSSNQARSREAARSELFLRDLLTSIAKALALSVTQTDSVSHSSRALARSVGGSAELFAKPQVKRRVHRVNARRPASHLPSTGGQRSTSFFPADIGRCKCCSLTNDTAHTMPRDFKSPTRCFSPSGLKRERVCLS